ncbi:MAG TPA: hypothetical protein PKC39_00260 [Ferruginibacter sp.]|nr:hypothetical protein [Ferruginibacter sp.]HMP19362.1 hypothetical protein [Ferruginibacter sp.]
MKTASTYHRLAALLLTVAFLAQTFSKGFIIADYYANTAAYIKNCINKARPQLHCNGKCQMMKKLAAEEKKAQEQAEHFGNLKLEVLSTKSFFPALVQRPSMLISANQYPVFNSGKVTDRSFDFFHPPQAA